MSHWVRALGRLPWGTLTCMIATLAMVPSPGAAAERVVLGEEFSATW